MYIQTLLGTGYPHIETTKLTIIQPITFRNQHIYIVIFLSFSLMNG